VPLPPQFPSAFNVSFWFSDVFVSKVMCQETVTLREALQKAIVTAKPPPQFYQGCVLRFLGTRLYAIEEASLTAPLYAIACVRENVLRRRNVAFCVERLPADTTRPSPRQSRRSANSATLLAGDGDLETTTVPCVPITAVPPARCFPIRILGVETVLSKELALRGLDVRSTFEEAKISFSVAVSVFYSNTQLSKAEFCTSESAKHSWFEWIVSDVPLCKLPRESHVVFVLRALQRGRCVPLSWSSITVYDENGFVRSGIQELAMWPFNERTLPKINEVLSQNPDRGALKLLVEFQTLERPLFCDQGMHARVPLVQTSTAASSPVDISDAERVRVDAILTRDPLHELTADDKALLWKNREWLRQSRTDSLPSLLLSANWQDYDARAEAIRLVDQWKPLSPVHALVVRVVSFAFHLSLSLFAHM